MSRPAAQITEEQFNEIASAAAAQKVVEQLMTMSRQSPTVAVREARQRLWGELQLTAQGRLTQLRNVKPAQPKAKPASKQAPLEEQKTLLSA